VRDSGFGFEPQYAEQIIGCPPQKSPILLMRHLPIGTRDASRRESIRQ